MSTLSQFGKYVPLVIGLIILVVIGLIAPWSQIGELIEKVSPQTFLLLAGLSAIYYVSKAIRFWYILRLLDIKQPFMPVTLLYLSGQPFSLLPAGELYRTVLLKKHLQVSMSKSSPSVTIQGLVEAVVLISFSLVGAFLIGRNQVIVAVVALLMLLLILALQRGWLSKIYPLLDKVPFLSISNTKYRRFIASHQQLLAPNVLAALVAFSLFPVLAGIGILFVSSRAIGFDISFIQSVIGYSLPVIISGLSFLPGGLGVSEGGTIGMVQLFGASAAMAVTITLLLRIFTLVAGLVYSVVAQVLLHAKKGAV